jgi:hypothetical protein
MKQGWPGANTPFSDLARELRIHREAGQSVRVRRHFSSPSSASIIIALFFVVFLLLVVVVTLAARLCFTLSRFFLPRRPIDVTLICAHKHYRAKGKPQRKLATFLNLPPPPLSIQQEKRHIGTTAPLTDY